MAKSATVERPQGLTPMMEQYWDVKTAHADCLIFYRMGDFYELFYDDALTAAPVLDIALTKRGKAGDGRDIPMCGVPVHAYETYLPRLIRAGHKVAVCEQIETPQQAKARGGYKALVKRDVVRVITAGTLTEDHLLEGGTNSYLACLSPMKTGDIGVAWMDVSTGTFIAQTTQYSFLPTLLGRIDPKELLISDDDHENPALFTLLSSYKNALTTQSKSLFNFDNAEKRLLELYQLKTLDGLGQFSRGEVIAAGSLLDYIRRTQKGACPHIRALRSLDQKHVMDMDVATRRNLEILKTLSGTKKGSLFGALDMCKTAAGSRLLSQRLSAPSCDLHTINKRLDDISAFIDAPQINESVTDHLTRLPDLERALARITVGRGSPRDLGQIRDALTGVTYMRGDLSAADNAILQNIANQLRLDPAMAALQDRLDAMLADDLPHLSRDGGFINQGASAKLDEYRALRKDGRDRILALERTYCEETDITTLKIKHNNVLGYFIDVTAKHGDRLMTWAPQPEANDTPTPINGRTRFIHRQTLANAVRFTTTDLTELESKIAQSAERALAIELELFEQMIALTLEQAEGLSHLAEILATVDLSCTQARWADEHHYTRPTLSDDQTFTIDGGRHPVVEDALPVGEFVANDCNLNDTQKIWLITGPNMAGKSTYLRQNALITLMAQAGLYVPATQAHIGLVDRLFSRVGAADDLARGQSTFMVEMVETAAILNQATDRSLVILDEIGRGTATFDGLSIAWATLEYLHDRNNCRALFATHYHELAQLTDRLPSLTCARVDVKEWEGDIVFLHKVVNGTADKSYGIHVARIAGVPAAVVKRAGQVLKTLENEQAVSPMDMLPLFHMAEEDAKATPHPAVDALQALDPDSLSPRDALSLIYDLKAKACD